MMETSYSNTMSNITVGIDYSMTSPAICVIRENHLHFYYWTTKRKFECKVEQDGYTIEGILFDYKDSPDEERFDYLAREIFEKSIRRTQQPPKIALEDYSYASTGRAFQIGENGGVLKNRFWKNGFKVQKIAPTQIKKFATGKGNADKEMMQESFIKDTGINLKQILGQTDKQWNPSSDMIDAYYIARYAHT